MSKIDIVIQKTSYVPGDTISGNVTLTLKRPVKARGLSVSLIGEYRTTQTTRQVRDPGDGNVISGAWDFGRVDRRILISDAVTKTAPKYDFKTTPKTARICAFKQQLDGESEYRREREYLFEIRMQADIPTSPIIKWYLLAKLDIPGGLDISKKVDITIG